MATLKAVLFDLDDTLVPEMEPEREALLIACGLATERYGTDAQKMSVTVGEAASKLWAQWSTPGMYSSIAYAGWEGLWGPPDVPETGLGNDLETITNYKRDAWNEVLSIHGILDVELRDEIIERHRVERVARIVPYEGAEEVLEQVKGEYLLAIVTNGAPAMQRFKLGRAGLSDYFSVVVASGDVGVGKPNPLPFTTALDALGITPAEAVMIGNSWSSDIQGSAGVGIPSIWFNADHLERPSKGESPTAEVDSLQEIPQAINEIANR